MKIHISRPALTLSAVLLVLPAAAALADGEIAIDSAHFPDAAFRACVSGQYDLDGDGFLSADERNVTELYVVGTEAESLQGAEYFTGVTCLTAVDNALTALDLSPFPDLVRLSCDGNSLTALDLSAVPLLESLTCTCNSMTALDLTPCAGLLTLECWQNGITSLDLSGCAGLETVNCSDNALTSLLLPPTNTLIRMIAENNALTTLDVTGCAGLWEINIANSSVSALDLSHNPDLESLNVAGNSMTALDLSHNPVLLELYCQECPLAALDLTYNPHIRFLDCGWNTGLTALDVSGCENLRRLVCCGTSLTSLDLSNNRNLRALDVHATGIASLDIGSAVGLSRYMTDDYRNTVRDFIVHGEFVDYTEPPYNDYVDVLAGVGHDADTVFTMDGFASVPIDEDHFPDAAFRAFVLGTADADGDAVLSRDEILGTTEMYATDLDTAIESLQGVEYFTELTVLSCAGNQLTWLDVTLNPELRILACFDNQLTGLDLRYNPHLEGLGCSGNGLTSLDLSAQQALTSLECNDNALDALSVDSCPALAELRCDRNSLTELTLYGNPELAVLTCCGNRIESIDVSGNPYLAQYADPDHFAWTDDMVFYGENIDAAYGQERGVKCDPWTQISGANALEVIRLNDAFFPDGQLLAVLSTEDYDWNLDGVLHGGELHRTDLCLDEGAGITSLAGIQCFPDLTELTCAGNAIGDLDLSALPLLTFLSCGRCGLQALDVSANPLLTVLDCCENELTELDVSRNTALTELLCYVNRLTALDVSQNTALVHLDCSFNPIEALDVSQNTAMSCLCCEATNVSTLDITACPGVVQYVNSEYFTESGIITLYGVFDPAEGYLTAGLSCYADLIIIGGSPVETGTVMYLPGDLETLEESALEGTAAGIVMVGNNCTSIGPRAFAYCDALRRIHIPGSVVSIADSAFEGSENVTILTNSAYVQSWADANGVAWAPEYYSEW